MKYSFIVPVYNRPDEVAELLESLAALGRKDDFEVIVVEDGSAVPCQQVCRRYEGSLNISYLQKANSGPGQSRNYGAERAAGQYLVILDSDVVVPPGYLDALDRELADDPCDAFGGPDAAHPSFTPVQKAISYAMTSFFTTGGIRGGKGKRLDRFFPRSFNMGVRRDKYLALGGFSRMRFGEDIDFSYRIVEAGLTCRLFPDAWVWHKRRTDLRKFYRQVYNSGIARINLEKRHPGTMKLVHTLPALFALGLTLTPLAALGCILAAAPWWLTLATLAPVTLYSLAILCDATTKNHSLHVGLLAVPAAFTQLCGYGFGFIEAFWRRVILRQDEFQAFSQTFYK